MTLYRKCLNNTCGQIFEILSANSKKIYCSTACKLYVFKLLNKDSKLYYTNRKMYLDYLKNQEKPSSDIKTDNKIQQEIDESITILGKCQVCGFITTNIKRYDDHEKILHVCNSCYHTLK